MSKKRSSKLKNILISVFSLIIGFVFGFIGDIFLSLPDSYIIPETVQGSTYDPSTNVTEGSIDAEVIKSNDISFHFIELGNKYTGDCIYIKCGNTDILVDGGSRASSVPFIYNYVDSFMTDDCLDYVIVTHAHQDHYAGYATYDGTESLFDHYRTNGKSTGIIIDFQQTNQKSTSTTYNNYKRERNEAIAAGAKRFGALDCFNNDNDNEDKILNEKEANRFYKIGEDETGTDILLQILYTRFYEDLAPSENDYSVCFQIIQGQYKYLFTGDLEAEGEESLVECTENNLSKVVLYKAGHHGSKTSSSEELLEVIQPMNVVVCCCAGSSEYTSKEENQFPTQPFIDRVSLYTDRIYVTTLCLDYKLNQFESFNGNIVICSKGLNNIQVYASNNTTKLKDTQWFKDNRTLPDNAVSS